MHVHARKNDTIFNNLVTRLCELHFPIEWNIHILCNFVCNGHMCDSHVWNKLENIIKNYVSYSPSINLQKHVKHCPSIVVYGNNVPCYRKTWSTQTYYKLYHVSLRVHTYINKVIHN